MFKTIVWATDGSENADEALSYAKELASLGGGTLVVAHCIETFVGSRAAGLPVHVDEEELKDKVERQVGELRDEGIDVRAEIAPLRPPGIAQMVADVARDANADVIVAGTRGHTPLGGLLLGSVTQRLLHVAPCPVLTVPVGRQIADREPAAAGQEATS